MAKRIKCGLVDTGKTCTWRRLSSGQSSSWRLYLLSGGAT